MIGEPALSVLAHGHRKCRDTHHRRWDAGTPSSWCHCSMTGGCGRLSSCTRRRRPTSCLVERSGKRAAAGHEIGNQTNRNPCSCAHSDSDPAYCLERLSMQQVWESVEASESVLDALIPIGNGKRSFAYPCYETWVGQGETRLSYVPLVATEFLAARGGPQRITNEPWSVDLSNVRARGCGRAIRPPDHRVHRGRRSEGPLGGACDSGRGRDEPVHRRGGPCGGR